MSIFQIVVLAAILIIVIKAGLRLRRKELSLILFLCWLGVWVALAVVVVFPAIVSWLANAVGIGRGVDLVIYLSIFSLFYFVFRINLRINKLEKNNSELIRKIAMQNARKTEVKKD
jgi:hypothetical protein